MATPPISRYQNGEPFEESTFNPPIDEIEQNIDRIDSDVDGLSTAVSNNDDDINNLQNDVSQNSSDINTLQSNVSGNDTDISNLQSDVSQNATDIGDLETTTSDHETRITDLESSGGGGLIHVDSSGTGSASYSRSFSFNFPSSGTYYIKMSFMAYCPRTAQGTNGVTLSVDSGSTNINSLTLERKGDTEPAHWDSDSVAPTLAGTATVSSGSHTIDLSMSATDNYEIRHATLEIFRM